MDDATDALTESYIKPPTVDLGTKKVQAYYESLLRGLTQRVDNYCSVVQGFGSLALMNDGVDPELAVNIDRMKHAAEETSRLMSRMLTLIKCPDAARQEVHPNTFFPTLERGIRHIGDGYGVAVAISIAPDLPTVVADPSRIWECLVELLRNACEAAASERGTVALDVLEARDTTGMKTDEVHVIVKNSGAVFPEDTIAAAFLPFRSSKFSEDADHFGLGLPVAETLAESMGAKIDISSSGATTKARLRLKIAQPLS